MGQEPADLRRDIERRREELGETIDAIGDRVSPGRIIERRRNRMSEGVRSFKDRVMGTVDTGTSAVTGAAGSVRDHASPEAITRQTAGSPLGAGAVAFGLGFLVAATLPASRAEQGVAQQAKEALEPAKQALTDAASSVAEDLKQDAADAAGQVKERASEAAGNVAGTAKDQAEQTRQDAIANRPGS